MSLWSRIGNVFRGDRVSREIEEELATHLAEAVESGLDPARARLALGSTLRASERSRDLRVAGWLDALRADVIFGWRQLAKHRGTSAAAILSLGLATGACTGAFRLIDALLFRPLPVTHAESLYIVGKAGIDPEGHTHVTDEWAYPLFEQMRDRARGRAELLGLGPVEPTDVTFGSDQEMEKANVQHVSGATFASFGLRPAAGRLLTSNDDLEPGAHPYAVLSYDYWTRRFGNDRGAVGRTFHMGNRVYQIVGVAAPPFTGTETGTVTAIFVPAMMHPFVTRNDATWLRIFARVAPGAALDPMRDQFQATFFAFESERLRDSGLPARSLHNALDQKVVVTPASSGASGMQRNFRLPLFALGVLVALVLLIACANVANLLTAQAAARAREMALRVSIGAGPWRLAQPVLVESALLASLAAALGAWFAWWSAPFVVARINPADNPARLSLPGDWRVFGFGLALTAVVTFLFGLAPALRASMVKPASALRGGEDPHSRRRAMHLLIAAQVAFCFLVIFVAGLLVATFDRLAKQSPGFSTDRLLALDTVTSGAQPALAWEQVARHLRTVPGVEAVALADWALMNGNSRNNFIAVSGARNETLAYFRYTTPGWLSIMKIPLIDGRDFRPPDASPGSAIVNEAFAKSFFHGEDPVGKWFERGLPTGGVRYQVVGLVRDFTYRSTREGVLPTALVPLQAFTAGGAVRPLNEGTLLVRTSTANPMALAPTLRREVGRARPGFRVTNVNTQAGLVSRQTIRERLTAMLALFFAAVALLLAGVGLYCVLDYSVVQRRREIGIRLAIGAPASRIAPLVTVEVFSMVVAGAIAGLALGFWSIRYVKALLYQVKATDAGMLTIPFLILFAAAFLAAVPAAIRALRTDPVAMLRAE